MNYCGDPEKEISMQVIFFKWSQRTGIMNRDTENEEKWMQSFDDDVVRNEVSVSHNASLNCSWKR